ncbi:MAG: type II secretion system F family protein [Candidatus Moranbacteria bacterium]|nr:type II secretion system F family protein [Candidatus Moranbacteria bacterium]
MSLYTYRARDEKGQAISGIMPAENKVELAHILKNQGLLLVFASQKTDKKKLNWQGLPFLRGVSLTEKMMFAKHLAVMVKSGLPIPRALEILSIQTKSNYFREALNNIKEKIKTGSSLADSLQDYPRVFPPLFTSSIRIGEIGGTLEEVLELLALQMQKEHDIRAKVRGAMIYPSVIVVVMIIIAVLMMIFVVPSLMKIFSEMNIELPITTRIIIAVSNLLAGHIIISLVGLVTVPLLLLFFKASPLGKKFFHFVFIHTPLVKNIIKKVYIARIARTLSSLLKSGVAIVNALDIIADSLENTYFKRAVKNASEMVQKGAPLNKSLANFPELFAPMVIQIVRVGEETGSSEQILSQLADFYEKEVDDITKNLSSVIKPALILIIGGAVGFFAISVIQPMYMVMDYME